MSQRIQLYALYFVALWVCSILVIGATHVWPEYLSIRILLTAGFLLLALFAVTQHYARWALAFVGFAILFNPFLYLNLTRDVWELLDLLSIFPVAFFTFRATNAYDKGVRFEQYVSTLFPDTEYEIESRTRDISKFTKRHVKSDTYPDFVFRERKTGKTFAVECKWRSKWIGGKYGEPGLSWNLTQGERYKEFSERSRMQVYVCFGIGGRPDKPKEVYFLKLEDLRWSFLKQSFVRGGMKAVTV